MTIKDKHALLQRYLDGSCTPGEKELVEVFWAEVQAEDPWVVPMEEKKDAHDRILSRINGELFHRITWRRYADVAAAVLIVAVAAWYVFSLRHKDNKVTPVAPLTHVDDVPPGDNRAVLTLAGGRRIDLDSAAGGLLASQGNGNVIKQNGELKYTEGKRASTGNEPLVVFNTLSTPRGGQYRLVLADGTKVWLDAASSITYPIAFNGANRQVSVTGQAYFEVAHNTQKPFGVRVQGQLIRDIGTAFNVNAYPDEPAMQVTLAGGAIVVGGTGKEVVLEHQGQQVEYSDGRSGTVGEADLLSVLAWKNGLFHFSSADIATIMRQIARWYDVDVSFTHGVPFGHITGEMPRNMTLANVLKVMQTSGVHFTIDKRKIIVTP